MGYNSSCNLIALRDAKPKRTPGAYIINGRSLSSLFCDFYTLDSCPRRRASTVTAAAPAQSSTKPERWQLLSAVCLERLPVVTQEMNAIEQEFARLMATMELEYSCLSDHELRHREDL